MTHYDLPDSQSVVANTDEPNLRPSENMPSHIEFINGLNSYEYPQLLHATSIYKYISANLSTFPLNLMLSTRCNSKNYTILHSSLL